MRLGTRGWFEELYQRASGSWGRVPWADLAANPHLVEWLGASEARASGKACLVVGCGLGDDAEALSTAGFSVVAFDISATAIQACRSRFPGSQVEYAMLSLDDFLDDETPPVHRFRALFDRR